MGTFPKVNGIKREGLPVYQNYNGQYLYYFKNIGWLVGSAYTSNIAGIRGIVSSPPTQGTCPDDSSIKWSYWNTASWVSGITVKSTRKRYRNFRFV